MPFSLPFFGRHSSKLEPQISDKELAMLLQSIVGEGTAKAAIQFLTACHDGFKTFYGLLPSERFFTKCLAYRGFELNVPYFVCDENEYSVLEAHLQFKRPSTFPKPVVSRSKEIVDELCKCFEEHYGRPLITHDTEGTQFDFGGSDCILYDEPHSSGQTPENRTPIRNDFVIIRFRRRPYSSPQYPSPLGHLE